MNKELQEHRARVQGGVAAEPKVGMGATERCWSDRHAYTIIEVKSAKTIVVTQDTAKRTDKNGMSESQEYKFSRDLKAHGITVTLRKNGAWIRRGGSMESGNRFTIGYRDEYHDFTF